MEVDNSSNEVAKARFRDALEKKKKLTTPNKGENRTLGKAQGSQSKPGGTRLFRRKSGSA